MAPVKKGGNKPTTYPDTRLPLAMVTIDGHDLSIDALKDIRTPSRVKVFPMDRDQIRYPLRQLYAIAEKMGFVKMPGRSIGTLRKTHATVQYEDHDASTAAESLGHCSGIRTVLESYVDHRSRKSGKLPRPMPRND